MVNEQSLRIFIFFDPFFLPTPMLKYICPIGFFARSQIADYGSKQFLASVVRVFPNGHTPCKKPSFSRSWRPRNHLFQKTPSGDQVQAAPPQPCPIPLFPAAPIWHFALPYRLLLRYFGAILLHGICNPISREINFSIHAEVLPPTCLSSGLSRGENLFYFSLER